MITGFDHVVVAVRDIERGVAAYTTLLGRSVGKRFVSDGVATALFDLNNIAVELIAPVDAGPSAGRLRAALEGGEGLKSVVFAVNDADAMHRRCTRIGLDPQAISGPASGDAGQYRVFRISAERTHGVRVFMLQRADGARERAPAPSSVGGLDHVVVQSADMERAAALYGARLGLDMRLDREVAGRRLMFFRCGDAVVEIAHVPTLGANDELWGLSWRVEDADAVRARLAAAGVNVSDVRAGMKPGTRVFTVRDGTCGVPTLMLESAKRD